MERRTAIKSIALSLGSLVSLPAWASGWNAATLTNNPTTNDGRENLMAALVETIIPTTDTLGAQGLGVHQFVQKMLADCYTQKAQDNFDKNLTALDQRCTQTYGKPFAEADAAQRQNLLQNLAQSTDENVSKFYGTLRGLTIQGYTSSEYYMTRFTDYEMAPARFYGCVPVK